MSQYDDDADRWGDDDEDDTPVLKTCKQCGKQGLEWHDTGVRWALMEPNGRLHTCGKTAKLSDFEDLT